MLKKAWTKRIVSVLCLLSILLPSTIIMANDKPKVEIIDEVLYFETRSKKASTGVRFKTVGFTVTRTKTNGDPNTVSKTGVIRLQSDWKKDDEDNEDGTVTTKFEVPEKAVTKALLAAGFQGIKPNDIVYLSAIFRIMEGNKEAPGEEYNTLKGITNARNWFSTADFPQYFDIEAKWHSSKKHSVSVEYQLYKSSGTTVLGTGKKGDFPTLSEYKTDSNILPTTKSSGGETYNLYRVYYVTNDAPTKKQGERKTSINPNVFYSEYLEDLKFVRDREFIVEPGGIKIVAMYRKFSDKPDTTGSEEMSREFNFEDIAPSGKIAADTRGYEQFDIDEGIPSTEKLYTNVISEDVISGYIFTRNFGKKVYTVKVIKPVTIKYEVDDPNHKPKPGEEKKKIEKTETRDIIKTYQVEREFSYWMIEQLGVYAIDRAEIKTGALDHIVTLTPKGYSKPYVSYSNNSSEDAHIKEPEIKDVKMPAQTFYQNTFPDFDFKAEAEKSVKEIKCKNDKLSYDGKVIMSDTEKEKETDKPVELPVSKTISKNVLFQDRIEIPALKSNGDYPTTGTLFYKPIVEINISPSQLAFEVEDLSDVVVHTPTVCEPRVEHKYRDNQMLFPTFGTASLVLDLPFHVTLPTTGNHRDIKGYGYNDYGKYISSREVRFPFDVYRGSSTSGYFLPKNTWTSIGVDTQFYLPIWVEEGSYTVDFRSIAINANGRLSATEAYANLEKSNYVANHSVAVEVSGRIYNLHIYDISDYPIWEDVFRKDGTNQLTGFRYYIGTKNQNGQETGRNPKYTIAPVNGSHPTYKNQGVLKPGYMTRFSLTTIGSMKSDNDYIRINPTFYYVDSKGKNRREVDIYYSETFNGKKNQLVKVGGAIDATNIKSIVTGDKLLAIPKEELYQTAFVQNRALIDILAKKRGVYTFKNIMLPPNLRTYMGYINTVPFSVNPADVVKSKQHWYGEYYLPSEIHIAPKDFDVLEYVKKNGSLNYKETFWLRHGYVIVNFEIETIQNGRRHLSYINKFNEANGYCNMWKREGFLDTKTDYKNNRFTFTDGDYILYDTNHSAASDWMSSGTH